MQQKAYLVSIHMNMVPMPVDDAETVEYSDEIIKIHKSYLEIWVEDGYVYDIIQ